MKKLTKKEKDKAVDIMRKATAGNDEVKWELINILCAFKSNAEGLTFPDLVKYIEKDYFNKRLKQVENEK